MKKIIFFYLLVLGLGSLNAQSMPGGFEAFTLGSSIQQIKDQLKQSTYFDWHGDPEVTMLSTPNTNLIDVDGNSFIKRGIFQFHEGKLFSLTLEMDPKFLDYYTLYVTLVKKYGDPASLDPSLARWEDAKVRLSLEKPLTVKYLDRQVMDTMNQTQKSTKNYQAITREKFLETF